jgi:hypothetical protein
MATALDEPGGTPKSARTAGSAAVVNGMESATPRGWRRGPEVERQALAHAHRLLVEEHRRRGRRRRAVRALAGRVVAELVAFERMVVVVVVSRAAAGRYPLARWALRR